MNKTRHRLLGILSKEYADGYHQEGTILDVVVTVPTILKKLDINYDDFVFMIQELLAKDEIKYLEVDNYFDQPVLYAQSSGVTAYANKKYLRADMERQREDIKFWAQLILPVLSFLIAAIALFLNMKTQTEINTVKESQKIQIPK
ncbi:hypothetical protein [Flavobacterium terrigena]|uniref:Uncharacterized protein n=1 Tax=Flavobacterium terrigena TaxID=402734 RepID=A0A1H6SAK6_9FLAO|nr:hypothetical protein [Flavobacterium terrigena]SEI62944.1 hypothetical protein SAMN05660918_1207 [Flavobacterium terrigena]